MTFHPRRLESERRCYTRSLVSGTIHIDEVELSSSELGAGRCVKMFACTVCYLSLSNFSQTQIEGNFLI